jgi:hypothetical protein
VRTEKVRQMHTEGEGERWVFRIRKWKYPAQCQRERELESAQNDRKNGEFVLRKREDIHYTGCSESGILLPNTRWKESYRVLSEKVRKILFRKPKEMGVQNQKVEISCSMPERKRVRVLRTIERTENLFSERERR